MSTLKVDTITDSAGTGKPNITGTVTIGGTALGSVQQMPYLSQSSAPSNPVDGTIWHDSNDNTFKIWESSNWRQVTATRPTFNYGDTALFAGGFDGSSSYDTIDTVTISVTGNATDFGDLTSTASPAPGGSDGSIGVFSRSFNGIDYITFATPGNATDFGDWLSFTFQGPTASCAGGGRALFQRNTVIEYITIATPGNATDFGDTINSYSANAGLSDGTYGLFCGGFASGGRRDDIEYVTIATLGNTIDFGDLTVARYGPSTASNTSRGLIYGGNDDTPTYHTSIDYLTPSVPSNASSFGDLTSARTFGTGTNNGSRAVFAGGVIYTPSLVRVDTIEYVTIATLGNGTDFGDLTIARNPGAASGD